ncbi:MAG TPA: UDP-N-acetylmuramate--L-alanine ligase [Candidatus Tyrphobacter sp.]
MEPRWHLIGIGGIGMSAIARVLLARGETVSGSDVKDSALLEQLREEGADVCIGHSAENVGGAQTVIVSSAIDARNPEYAEALRRKIPVLHRGEMLARLVREGRGIAICGTHGKTTTTAMVHAVLRGGGIDASLVLGGIDATLGSNAYVGSDSWLVTEADESDGSFTLLEPKVAVVTNIENDHLKSNDELPHLVDAFAEFVCRVPDDGLVALGADDPLAASLSSRGLRAGAVTFGLREPADLLAREIRTEGLRSSFDVIAGGVCLGSVELGIPGGMNVRNALGAIAVGRYLEVPFARIADALHSFRGVRRRFDVLCRDPRMIVVDDYAHHPTAIRETIATARACHRGPLIVAFQPHRYTRTAFLARDFAQALRGADRVYLAPVYAASESPIPGISSASIGEPLAALGGDVACVADVGDLESRLLSDVPSGSLVLMLGAGDITDVAARLARRIQPEESFA